MCCPNLRDSRLPNTRIRDLSTPRNILRPAHIEPSVSFLIYLYILFWILLVQQSTLATSCYRKGLKVGYLAIGGRLEGAAAKRIAERSQKICTWPCLGPRNSRSKDISTWREPHLRSCSLPNFSHSDTSGAANGLKTIAFGLF